MIVDDEPVCLKLTRKFLRDVGYENFTLATDSTVAIDLMLAERPDIILLDFVMPKVDGMEILRQRRCHAELRDIPIIMLTASQDTEVKVAALKLGAADFLAKPVDSNELIPRVRNSLIVKAHHDHLRRMNALLEDRVKEQTQALQEAYEELQSLDKLKSQFMTLVSHELRTPLSGITCFLEILTLAKEDKERGEAVATIQAQAARLEHIVKDIERFLALTAGRVITNIEPVDARSILLEQAVHLKSAAEGQGLELKVEAPQSAEIKTDRGLLGDCLRRLGENALKFTTRGWIVFRLRTTDSKVMLEVEDSGCGIDPLYRDNVLIPLSVAGAVEHHSEGRGLGLAIVRSQMSLLGGSIEFESLGRGHGSMFRLILTDSRRERGRSTRVV